MPPPRPKKPKKAAAPTDADGFELLDSLADSDSAKSLTGYLKHVVIDSRPEQRKFIDAADPWQLDICRNLIPMIEHAAGNRPDYTGPRFAFISLPKGHDKTSLVARLVMWAVAYGKNAKNSIVAYAAASDAKQAEILHDSAKNEAKANPWLNKRLRFVEGHVQNAANHNTKIEILNSDSGGASGIKPDIIVGDELVFWKDEQGKKLFDVLFAATNKRPNCCFIIITNAGIINSWQDKVRTLAKSDPAHWYVNDEVGHRASWVSYEANKATAAFVSNAFAKRMFDNVWTHADEEDDYVSRDQVTACVDLPGEMPNNPDFEYIFTLDLGWVKDYAAAAIMHRDPRNLQVYLDKLMVFKPSRIRQTPMSLMIEWGEYAMQNYRLVEMWIDPNHLLEFAQHFERRIEVVKFGCGPDHLALLAEHLKIAVLNKTIHLYPGAGIIQNPDGTTFDLVDEMASLIVVQMGSTGKYRFTHRPGLHDDRCMAVAMGLIACLKLPIRHSLADFHVDMIDLGHGMVMPLKPASPGEGIHFADVDGEYSVSILPVTPLKDRRRVNLGGYPSVEMAEFAHFFACQLLGRPSPYQDQGSLECAERAEIERTVRRKLVAAKQL
jgi:hypothetical protein